LRTSNPTNPNIKLLEAQLADTIASDNRRRWRTELDSFSHRQDSGRLWRTITTLSGKKPRISPNQPITFSNRTHTDQYKIANSFCRQFSNTVVHTSDRAARSFKRKVRRDHPLNHNTQGFSTNMVLQAIKACSNSIATGPNGLTMLHIKHLGPRGIQYLTDLFTLSLRSADIPSIWRQATIIPIPKVGKPRDLGTSYRPISLLCPGVKVLEKLILPQLTHHLQLVDSQHGFRRQHSTTSALLPLVHKVATGFNKPKPPDRTVLMAIDFSKALDTVNHTKLLQAVSNSSLPHNTVRWLVAYLRGRSASCRYNNAT